MVLTDEKIREFQELYKEHFGIEISKEDARENGIKLLQMISLIYRPKIEKQSDENQAQRVEQK